MIKDYLIESNEVIEIGDFSRAYWFDIQNPRSRRYDPTVPARIYISSRLVRYWHSEVIAWLESKRKNGVKDER